MTSYWFIILQSSENFVLVIEFLLQSFSFSLPDGHRSWCFCFWLLRYFWQFIFVGIILKSLFSLFYKMLSSSGSNVLSNSSSNADSSSLMVSKIAENNAETFSARLKLAPSGIDSLMKVRDYSFLSPRCFLFFC